MAEQNPIRYSDLISPDDSIEKLIGQLEQLNTSYSTMAANVKQQAQGLAQSLQSVSGATQQGRKTTKEASEEAKRLEKAYKALDAALAANAKEIAKLNIVKREANNYNKQMVLRGKEEITTRKQIAEASYQQLSAQYSLNKAYINTLSATDRNIKANKELIQSTREIYEQMKKLQADTGKMQLNVGNYPSLDAKSIVSSLIGVTTATGAVVTAIGALKTGVSTAMDYEHALSGLAAILSTTKDNITELSEQARDLGATTAFTAKEAVELQTELAKLGYTTQDILNMSPQVLSFAMATGSSLADAASLTGAALRMFEKDTSHTQEFVDKMTASTTKSALSFSYLQNALSTVSPVANAFGFKIEEVLALLGQLANAGFDASSAATATRNILLNLADANGKLAKALGEPVTNLDDLISGLKNLDAQGVDLNTTLELTDKRSVAAFNTFLAGTDNVLGLRDALNDCNGAAAQMAKTMGDDLSGDLKTLQSAWEDLMIEINNGQGILRSVVQWITKLVRSWKEYLSLPKSKDDILNAAAEKYDDGTFDDNGNIIKPATQTTETKTTETKTRINPKTKTKTAKELRAEQTAARKREQEQKQHEKRSLELRRQYEDAMIESFEDADVRERAKIVSQYDRKIEDLKLSLEKEKKLSVEDRQNINKTIEKLEEAKMVKLAELVDKGAKKQREIEERKKKENERLVNITFNNGKRIIDAEYRTQLDEIDMLETSEKEKTRLRLEAERERIKKLLALYKQNGKTLTQEEKDLLERQLKVVEKDLEKNSKNNRDIFDLLGFKLSEDKKQGITDAFSFAMDNLTAYMDAWVQAADKKVELANKEVESTKSVLDAEIEARNKGYASNVAMAQKEYDMAKKNQQKALEEQKRAQKAQAALQTIQQASNLVSASALIWAQLGFPWAIPAIAVMWGSFAAAKIKAAQVTSQGEEQYGEGTVELLEGGSHQSGNDIDLGRKKDGTRRRAEGGEYFAVINKRSSRRYRSLIPDVVNSLNQGTFAQKYMRAYDDGGLNVNVQQNGSSPDLRNLSEDVRLIRQQGEEKRYVDGNGNVVIQYKNLRRIIRS